MAAGIRDEPLRACLHEGGEPQVGEVTCGRLPHLTCKRDHIKMKDYIDRRVTPPKRVTSPIWGPPPPCKQALRTSAWEATGPSGNHLVSKSLELWYQDSQESKTNCFPRDLHQVYNVLATETRIPKWSCTLLLVRHIYANNVLQLQSSLSVAQVFFVNEEIPQKWLQMLCGS